MVHLGAADVRSALPTRGKGEQGDDLTRSEISGVINSTKDWGSIPEKFAEKLIASTKSRINWRTALAGFPRANDIIRSIATFNDDQVDSLPEGFVLI